MDIASNFHSTWCLLEADPRIVSWQLLPDNSQHQWGPAVWLKAGLANYTNVITNVILSYLEAQILPDKQGLQNDMEN